MKSHLRIFDLDRGGAETLMVHDGHIEAPNWDPSGSTLIVNGGGLLYRVPLEAPGLQRIDTGFAVHCNNDHGISPSGATLIISDSSEDGDSAVYTLSAQGGRPLRITPNTPSYWHGVSPDGRELAFVGNRGAGFQVFTVPVEGGEETRLTEDFDHCDGPDYTPDGQWIWFNGERGGAVDLWRMQRDGSGLERMTADEAVNWFPHPSPNGDCVVYLAYPPGTQGHPGGLDVELRLLPADGGAPKTLLALHGGQGTINVPSWAPEGRRFAFVSYEDEGA
ncbi:TolB family protein [Salibaculum griseiflavum]|uniref:WD40-like Beta Propeller Repeat n=1 Tax=Salibaculum griseiflavum TaxID=1914409 RepID=A0A2V1P423_9RHOB|nr:TolB family protein [Salibaculum griseiflavum]PWG17175.1 hypothetical protein DFK10_07225 [Salibaculum griseiflavum]